MSNVSGLKILWRFMVIATVMLSAIFVVLSFTPMAHISNCGGNSSALHRLHTLKMFAAMTSFERPEGVFSFSELSESELDQLKGFVSSGWNKEAKFYVVSGRMNFQAPVDERRIIAVCDTAYRNVPEHRMGMWRWPAPPTHAVAFSDGTTGLISPEEYAEINRADMIDVASILARQADDK